jgi:hypothetical protein
VTTQPLTTRKPPATPPAEQPPREATGTVSGFVPTPPLDPRPLEAAPPVGLRQRFAIFAPLAHPFIYSLYLIFATLDITLTWIILHLGGAELNHIADWIIVNYDIYGAVVYKYGLVAFVITICEVVTRAKPRVGRRLAEWSVAITVIPVVVALIQIWHSVIVEKAEWQWVIH